MRGADADQFRGAINAGMRCTFSTEIRTPK
jgi:hypothetical protein